MRRFVHLARIGPFATCAAVVPRIARQNASAPSAARQTCRRVWPHPEAFSAAKQPLACEGEHSRGSRDVDPFYTIMLGGIRTWRSGREVFWARASKAGVLERYGQAGASLRRGGDPAGGRGGCSAGGGALRRPSYRLTQLMADPVLTRSRGTHGLPKLHGRQGVAPGAATHPERDRPGPGRAPAWRRVACDALFDDLPNASIVLA
jgi:hypothetical protein